MIVVNESPNSEYDLELADKAEHFMIILPLIFRAENSFYKLSNLTLSDNSLKRVKVKEETDRLGTREVTLRSRRAVWMF